MGGQLRSAKITNRDKRIKKNTIRQSEFPHIIVAFNPWWVQKVKEKAQAIEMMANAKTFHEANLKSCKVHLKSAIPLSLFIDFYIVCH